MLKKNQMVSHLEMKIKDFSMAYEVLSIQFLYLHRPRPYQNYLSELNCYHSALSSCSLCIAIPPWYQICSCFRNFAHNMAYALSLKIILNFAKLTLYQWSLTRLSVHQHLTCILFIYLFIICLPPLEKYEHHESRTLPVLFLDSQDLEVVGFKTQIAYSECLVIIHWIN